VSRCPRTAFAESHGVHRLNRRRFVDYTRVVEGREATMAGVMVKRRPVGAAASNTRVSPPLTPRRSIKKTATKSTPSRCAPSGVGRPMPSRVSIRNWWASTNQGSTPDPGSVRAKFGEGDDEALKPG